MIPVFRLGFVTFFSKDVEAMVDYYITVLGCKLVERGGDGVAYISTGAEHHNIVIQPSNESFMEGIGWQVNPEVSLEYVQSLLEEEGIVSELVHDRQVGIPEQLQLHDPDGNRIFLYHSIDYSAPGYATSGIIPTKLGHLSISVKDAKKTVDFYHHILGFYKTDRILDLANFLTCNEDHHTINIIQGKKSYMHHIAFQLRNPAHQYDSSDILMKHNIPTIWGPSRHTAGHNIASYHLDPDKHVIELYTDMDKYIPELNILEPRPWHKELPLRPKTWQSFEHWETQFGDTLPTVEDWKQDRPKAIFPI
ncbi:VOC family protein [Bacillus sp. E214]|uniref:VOC family protein n=1 Tax=Bacillus sp. E214 TaxID=2587156 RepID=UPI0011DFCEA5|nr:VOC family protein [Bacillus sp. E214]